MRKSTVAISLMVLALSACAQESKAPPVSTDISGGSQQEPQPANALPRGSAVDAPLDPVQGNIGTTRVGPAVRSSMPMTRPRVPVR